MKTMPYALKQKLRRYDAAMKKAAALHLDLQRDFEAYGVPSIALIGGDKDDSTVDVVTEALTFITCVEGDIDEHIQEIEEVFLYYVNTEEATK